MENKINYLEFYTELTYLTNIPFYFCEGYEDDCRDRQIDYLRANMEEEEDKEVKEYIEVFLEKLYKDSEGKYYRYLLFNKHKDSVKDIIKNISEFNFDGNILHRLEFLKSEFIDYINEDLETQTTIIRGLEKVWIKDRIKQLNLELEQLIENEK